MDSYLIVVANKKNLFPFYLIFDPVIHAIFLWFSKELMQGKTTENRKASRNLIVQRVK